VIGHAVAGDCRATASKRNSRPANYFPVLKVW